MVVRQDVEVLILSTIPDNSWCFLCSFHTEKGDAHEMNAFNYYQKMGCKSLNFHIKVEKQFFIELQFSIHTLTFIHVRFQSKINFKNYTCSVLFILRNCKYLDLVKWKYVFETVM